MALSSGCEGVLRPPRSSVPRASGSAKSSWKRCLPREAWRWVTTWSGRGGGNALQDPWGPQAFRSLLSAGKHAPAGREPSTAEE